MTNNKQPKHVQEACRVILDFMRAHEMETCHLASNYADLLTQRQGRIVIYAAIDQQACKLEDILHCGKLGE